MFAQERQEAIIEWLHRDGKVMVKDLSSYFQVTEDCIRKDLTVLEKKKLLCKKYGGAVPVRKEIQMTPPIATRLEQNQNVKRVIAEKAFALIQDNETVFLDISTTNMLLAEKLAVSSKRVTVITNMIDIVTVLNKPDNQIHVICTGGVLSKYINGFTGSMTIASIANYKPNKAFIGSCGVDIQDKSITTLEVEDGNTKQAVIKNSKQVYLVMESTKFYYDGPFKFSHLGAIDAIITEAPPQKEILSVLRKNNVKVF